jgi:hypothetical protein
MTGYCTTLAVTAIPFVELLAADCAMAILDLVRSNAADIPAAFAVPDFLARPGADISF